MKRVSFCHQAEAKDVEFVTTRSMWAMMEKLRVFSGWSYSKNFVGNALKGRSGDG